MHGWRPLGRIFAQNYTEWLQRITSQWACLGMLGPPQHQTDIVIGLCVTDRELPTCRPTLAIVTT